MRNSCISVLFLLLISLSGILQGAEKSSLISGGSDPAIDVQWFLAYQYGEEKGESHNEFLLKRGYVNIKKQINDGFSGRITTDITVDEEGDGEGDVEMRLKYLYLKNSLPSIGPLHKPFMEFGMVHRPWIDFQQEINVYRLQGNMFLERNKVISSADYGIYFHSFLGGDLDRKARKALGRKSAGRYGSLAFGVFNGGGYHAIEKNENKTVEGRLTLRPLPGFLPGLQTSYHGAVGNGNTEESPNWMAHSGFVSYEHPMAVLTAEFYSGEGNIGGTAIQDTLTFEAVPQNGYSLFAELKFLRNRFSLFGRYDHFVQGYDSGDKITDRSIAGLAYHLTGSSKIILDYDTAKTVSAPEKDSRVLELALELKY